MNSPCYGMFFVELFPKWYHLGLNDVKIFISYSDRLLITSRYHYIRKRSMKIVVNKIKREWVSNVRGDILSGIVVALALIPEAIAFLIIAGVDPMVGLYASFIIAVVISFVGGRPGMISAATGAMALVIGPLVRDYGLYYLLAATILTGIIQILFGVFKIAKLMKFIPNAVMIGFVNALAILIFMAQVPHFVGINNVTYVFVVIT